MKGKLEKVDEGSTVRPNRSQWNDERIHILLGRNKKILEIKIWSLFFLHGPREGAQKLGDQLLSLRGASTI